MRRITVNPGDPDRPLFRPNEYFGLRSPKARDWLLFAGSAAIGLALLVLAFVLGISAAHAASAGQARWFHSPSGNISCEVGVNRPGIGTYVYCATFRPLRCVTLRRTGMRVRAGGVCRGNEPENAFTLRYSSSVRLGPFRCTSLRVGMRCIFIRSTHGFLISREALKRF